MTHKQRERDIDPHTQSRATETRKSIPKETSTTEKRVRGGQTRDARGRKGERERGREKFQQSTRAQGVGDVTGR